MTTPFALEARCETRSIGPGKATLWASFRVDARGNALERERAPLAVVLVIDASGSMKGEPLAHALESCEIVAALLDARDRIAVVTFSDNARVCCGLVTADDAGRTQLAAALRAVGPESATNIHAGMQVAAGILATAPAGLRRVMVVLSDGQPNRGLATVGDLAAFTQSLRPIGVSTLGFGAHHDENVLAGIATAGSGRYAYVPDPLTARVDLARAALAHGGIVAENLELELRPAEGVEVVRILPSVALRIGGHGMRAPIGDVFIDEGRPFAVELAVDLAGAHRSRGELAELVVSGSSPDGKRYDVTAKLVVDVHGGPHAVDRDAQREVLLVRGEAARSDARAHADRGGTAPAAAVLRELIKQIDASEAFVRDDGSPLAELREQLEDEAANYERVVSKAEYQHQRKTAVAYTPTLSSMRAQAVAPGYLVGLAEIAGRHRLFVETKIGRSTTNELPIPSDSLSRCHARILYINDVFQIVDMGSTNGTKVNGQVIFSHELVPGDVVELGRAKLRFERDPDPNHK